MVKKKIVMLALTAVLLLTTYSVPVSAAENAAVIGTVGNRSNKVKKVTYTNLVDSIGYTIVYLCSNHTSY